jgi:hypothetical protein
MFIIHLARLIIYCPELPELGSHLGNLLRQRLAHGCYCWPSELGSNAASSGLLVLLLPAAELVLLAPCLGCWVL